MPEQFPRILFLDIETMPLVINTWGIWQQNAIKVLRWSTICAFDAKWAGESTHITRALPDYAGYRPNSTDDSKIIKDLWKLIDEADIVVAHNGDEFDIKKINAAFIKHKMSPPSPCKSVDTKKAAKRAFRFDSNRLNDLCDVLGIGKKINTGGFELWEECLAGDMKAWARMKKYNRHDVVLLEQLYYRLLPWISNHPNVSLWVGRDSCPKCGSDNIQYRGYAMKETRKYRRFQCNSCGGWAAGTKVVNGTTIKNA